MINKEKIVYFFFPPKVIFNNPDQYFNGLKAKRKTFKNIMQATIGPAEVFSKFEKAGISVKAAQKIGIWYGKSVYKVLNLLPPFYLPMLVIFFTAITATKLYNKLKSAVVSRPYFLF